MLRRVLKDRLGKGWFSAALAIALTAMGLVSFRNQATRSAATPGAPSDRFAIRHVVSDKPVYPYSVVAGGVHTVAEARQAAAQDPLVRDHYSGVQLGRLVPTVLKADVSAYVSYRKRGRIYWTAKAIPLKAGEAVLADGRNRIRKRCGNRISLTPQQPVITPASQEPDATEFETAVSVPPVLSGVDMLLPSSSTVPEESLVDRSGSTRGSPVMGNAGEAVAAGNAGPQNGSQPYRAGAGTSPGFPAPADVLDAILPTDEISSTVGPGYGEQGRWDQPNSLFAPRPIGAAYSLGPLSLETSQAVSASGSTGSGQGRSNDRAQAVSRALGGDTFLIPTPPQPSLGPGVTTQPSGFIPTDEIPPPPPIPEPQTYLLVGAGLLVVLLRSRSGKGVSPSVPQEAKKAHWRRPV